MHLCKCVVQKQTPHFALNICYTRTDSFHSGRSRLLITERVMDSAINNLGSLRCAPCDPEFWNYSRACCCYNPESCRMPFHHNSASWRALRIDSLVSWRRDIPARKLLI